MFFTTVSGLRSSTLGLALALASASLAHGQDDDLDFLDDELDALIEGDLFDEGSASDGILRSFQGFSALEARTYWRDRGGETNDEQLLFRSEFELDLRFSDSLTGYARPRILVDLLDGDYQRFEPFEAYATYDAGDWDLRAGSMVENWGIVDTFNPVDVLNRRDFGSNLLNADRLGEIGFRLRREIEGNETIGEPTLSLYVLPVWQATPFAPEDQRFAIAGGPLAFDEDAGFDPASSERLFFGGRVQATLNTGPMNADVQLIAADGPSRFPAIALLGGTLAPAYYHARTLGIGIRAVPNEAALGALAKYTFKAEIAHVAPDTFDDSPIVAPDDYTTLVVGVDRVFDGVLAGQDSLTTTVEYAHESGASDPQASYRPFRDDLILRALWEANDFERTSLEARALFDIDNHEFIGELIYETQLRSWHEDLKWTVQVQYFDPASATESLFGLFPNNSSLMTGVRWSF